MQDEVQRRCRKDPGCIFLGIYSLHSGSFPNNELKQVLGSFTASSQLKFPTWIFYSATDNAQLPSVQIHPDKWLGPHRTCGPGLWYEIVVSVGELDPYMAPQRRGTWQMYNSTLQWGELTLSPPGCYPTWAPRESPAVCTGTINAPVSFLQAWSQNLNPQWAAQIRKKFIAFSAFSRFSVSCQPPPPPPKPCPPHLNIEKWAREI